MIKEVQKERATVAKNLNTFDEPDLVCVQQPGMDATV